ncbi:MAG: hypothetical protein PGN11_01795 [Quadrisphaera sp.]
MAACDRITSSEDEEWWRWEEGGLADEALAAVCTVRDALAG